MSAFLSRIGSMILNTILKKIAKFVFELIKLAKFKKERAAEQEKAKEKYEEVLQNEQSTKEERAKAYEDLINSGRK